MWNDLTMAQKNELMQYYIKNGVTSLDQMQSHYNTFAEGGPKESANKKTYNEWISEMASKYPWLETNSQRAGYDYERYFNENYEDALSRLTELEPRHFTDRYKLPNHPTFSNESVYSRGRQTGGTWVGDDMFMPSAYNAERYPWLKPYKPVTEDYIYSFKDGGHLFAPSGKIKSR